MSERPDTSRHSLPTDVELRVDDICDRFESAWRAGEHPRVEDYLSAITEPGRSALVRELVPLDIVYRRQRGKAPTAGDYSSLFPTGTPDWLDHEIATGKAGRYQLEGELGHGGMGVVFRANDPNLGRELAVKVLPPGDRNNPAARDRFLREATITARLQHPNIPPVHECGQLADGRPFFAMKLIRGRTLNELLSERPAGAPDVSRWLPVFLHVCQGVAYAHSRGVIHRDLKPRNIMVGEFGEVQVMDWGLAKVLSDPPADADHSADAIGDTPRPITTPPVSDPRYGTQAGAVMGTWPYLPPEQARGEVERLDPRCDVFSLGALLCEILTGKPPYTGTRTETLRKAQAADLTDAWARLDRCGADPELVKLCQHCLEADRAARPADAGAVAERVSAYQKAVEDRLRQAERDRAAAEARAVEQRKRRKVQLALAGAVLLLVTGAAAFAWWDGEQATRRKTAEFHQQLKDEHQAGVEQGRQDRNGDQIETLLTRCAEVLREDNAPLAGLLLAEAEAREKESGTDRFKARFARCRADLTILKELDRIDDYRWTPVEGKYPTHRQVAAEWRTAFGRFGIDETKSAAEAARLVNESLIRERLLTSLDLWLFASRPTNVLTILQTADPDESRTRLREAVAAGDNDRVQKLIGELSATKQPTWFAVVLGSMSFLPTDLRKELLFAALQQRPNNFRVLMTIGLVATFDPRVTLAERAAWHRAALAVRPSNLSAWIKLGNVLADMSDHKGAIAAYRVAVELQPGSAATHTSLGAALLKQGEIAEAIEEFREAIRIESKFAFAHNNLGLALEKQKKHKEAIAAYREAIRLDPEYASAHNNLGVALYRSGQTDEAITILEKAVKLDPDDARPHNNLGNALGKKGRWKEAVAAYEEAIRLDPKYATPHYNLGLRLAERKDWGAAITRYEEAIQLDKTVAAFHNSLGIALKNTGKPKEAIRAYEEAIRLDPNYVLAYRNLANVLADQKDRKGAIAKLQRAVELDKTDAETYYNLGSLLGEEKDYTGAIAAYREAIRIRPDYISAHFNLGSTLANRDRKGDLDEAIVELGIAYKLDPDNPIRKQILDRALKRKTDREAKVAPPPREVNRP